LQTPPPAGLRVRQYPQTTSGEGCPGRPDAERRSLPQNRHLMASSWIISAQKGHFFIRFTIAAHQGLAQR
jgi:hypothetical protein